MPDFGREIPLGWLKFVEKTTELVEKGTLRLKLAELKPHAAACSIGTEELRDWDSGASERTPWGQELDLLLRLLTDVGVLMHFNAPSTRDLVVLKPQWLLDSMRELCDAKELLRKSKSRHVAHDAAPEWRMLLSHGRLDAEKLGGYIWADGDEEERMGILGLMQRFGLCCMLPHHAEIESPLFVVPSLLPCWTPSTRLDLWKDDNSVVATVRSIHADSYWEVGDPSSFMPEAVFWNLQVALLGQMTGADVRACRHLYRERALFFGTEDYFVERVASDQLLRIVVRIEGGGEAAAVAHRVMECLQSDIINANIEGKADKTGSRNDCNKDEGEGVGIATRFGLQFQLAVDCTDCGAPIPVVEDHFGSIVKCPQCRTNQAETVKQWRRHEQADRSRSSSSLCSDGSVAELGPTLREAMGGRDQMGREEWQKEPSAAISSEFEKQHMLIPWEQLTLDDKRGAALGEGGFGTVMKMWFLESTEVAVKALHTDVTEIGSPAAADFLREMEHLKSLHHPNVIQMLGVTRGSFGSGSGRGTQWMMVVEFMRSGSLYDWLHRRAKPLPWRWRVRVLSEVAKAMVYLHSDMPSKAPIVHLDLKPANILLSGDRIKVADFGLSRAGQHTTGGGNEKSEGKVQATIEYMAPEIYLGDGFGTATDVYAFGTSSDEYVYLTKAKVWCT